MAGSLSARLRHYFGLHGAESKFRRLLHDFHVQPLISAIGELKTGSSLTPCQPLEEISFEELGSYLGA